MTVIFLQKLDTTSSLYPLCRPYRAVQSGGDVDAAIDQLVSSAEAKDQDYASFASLPANNSSDTYLVAPSRLKTAAEAFHSSSSARQDSLAKRREALLKHARKRFLVTTNQTGANVDY